MTRWLQRLSEILEFVEVPNFSKDAHFFLRSISEDFNIFDVLEVLRNKEHVDDDFKALQQFLANKCQSNAEVTKALKNFGFACTFDDIDNCTFAMGLWTDLEFAMIPCMFRLQGTLFYMGEQTKNIPMVSRPFYPTRWLQRLSEISEFDEVPNFSKDACSFLRSLSEDFSAFDAWEVLTNKEHVDDDFKALQQFLVNKCQFNAEVAKETSFTLGEEILNFSHRLTEKIEVFRRILISTKLTAGAVAAYPNVKWEAIAEDFVRSLGMTSIPHYSQRGKTNSTFLRKVYRGIAYSLVCYNCVIEKISYC